jgi:hypothetical protein
MSMESEIETTIFNYLMEQDVESDISDTIPLASITELRSLMKEAYRMGVESKERELNKTLEDLFDVEAAKNERA